ncbi:13909_t:CDS:2, partial [Gigaspora margarita]
VERYSTSIESSIACTKNNKDHIDNYYEYMMKKNQASRLNTLYEVKQYLNELVATCDFLAMPATSIASEQMFSCARHIINDYYTSLDPETVTALMYQRNWLEMVARFGWD